MSEDIFSKIYEVVRQIPKGRVTSYGAIAKYIGTSARVVGWAMRSSGSKHGVPAHRVVNAQGQLSAKEAFGGNRMQKLLEKEGVQIEKDQIVSFKKILWLPLEELK